MLFARTEKGRDSRYFVGVVVGGGGDKKGSTRRNGRLVFHLRSHVKINYKLNDIFHFGFGQFNSISWYHSFVSFLSLFPSFSLYPILQPCPFQRGYRCTVLHNFVLVVQLFSFFVQKMNVHSNPTREMILELGRQDSFRREVPKVLCLKVSSPIGNLFQMPRPGTWVIATSVSCTYVITSYTDVIMCEPVLSLGLRVLII